MSDFGDGKTHQSVDDITIMRVLPNMQVFSPADAVETAKIVKAMAEIPGPCYIRVNRNDLPECTDPGEPFVSGKVKTLREGKDVVIFATGYMVYQALEAAKALEAEGISAKVVNVATIKPFDTEGVQAAAAGMKRGCNRRGSQRNRRAWVPRSAKRFARGRPKAALPVGIIGIQDSFGTCAQSYEELLRYYHLMPQDIVDKVKSLL